MKCLIFCLTDGRERHRFNSIWSALIKMKRSCSPPLFKKKINQFITFYSHALDPHLFQFSANVKRTTFRSFGFWNFAVRSQPIHNRIVPMIGWVQHLWLQSGQKDIHLCQKRELTVIERDNCVVSSFFLFSDGVLSCLWLTQSSLRMWMGGWERGLDLSVSPCFTIRKPGKTVFSCSTLLNQNLHTYPFGMVSMFTVCGLAQNLKSLSLYIFKWKNSEMLFTYSSSTQMLS